MRILVIGNGEHSLLNFRRCLIAKLVGQGHEVVAAAPDFTPRGRAAVAELGAHVADFHLSRSGLSPLSAIWSIASLIRMLRRERADAVLCYFIKPAIFGTLAAFLTRVPRRVALLEGLGFGLADDPKSRGRKALAATIKTLLTAALRRAHCVMVLNDDDLREVRDRLGVAQTVNVGAIGVELDRFAQRPIPEGPITFTMASRLIAEKGVYQFIEAARAFRGDARVRFVLLGGLDDNPGCISDEELRAWVDEEIIEWPGHVSDVAERLAASHVFVLPSYYREGVPRSIQEAMAVGRPIITSDSVGCRDTVDPGVNGFLVAVRDSDALVRAMRQFLDHPELITRMGSESRRLAEMRFDAMAFDEMLAKQLTHCESLNSGESGFQRD